MKQIILRVFATNYGTILRWITSIALGLVLAAAARIGLEITEEQTAQLAAVTTAAVSGLLGELIVKWQGNSIAEIQAAVKPWNPRVAIDEWAGPQTIAAVQRAARAVKAVHQAEAATVAADLR